MNFVENLDILAAVSNHVRRPKLVIGFAAETNDVIESATAKRLRKGCDWIVANDVTPAMGTMGGTNNTVTVIDENGAEAWSDMPKTEVASRLALRIAGALS